MADLNKYLNKDNNNKDNQPSKLTAKMAFNHLTMQYLIDGCKNELDVDCMQLIQKAVDMYDAAQRLGAIPALMRYPRTRDVLQQIYKCPVTMHVLDIENPTLGRQVYLLNQQWFSEEDNHNESGDK